MSQPPQDSRSVNNPRSRWTPESNIIGFGIRPKNGANEYIQPGYQIGSFTDEDPAIIYGFRLDNCQYFGRPEQRRHIQRELKDVCRVTKMECIVVRKETHARTVQRDDNGAIVYRINRYGVREPVRVYCPFRLTVFLGRNLNSCLLEGHIYTRMVFQPDVGEEVVQIMDDAGNRRWNKDNLEPIELWLTSRATDTNAPRDDTTTNTRSGSGRGGVTGGGITRGAGVRGVTPRAANMAAALTGASSPATTAGTTTTSPVSTPPTALVTPHRSWAAVISGPRTAPVRRPPNPQQQQQQQPQQQQPQLQQQQQPGQQQHQQLQQQQQIQQQQRPHQQFQQQQQPVFPANQTGLNPSVPSFQPQPQFSYGAPATSPPNQSQYHTLCLLYERIRSDIHVVQAELRAANAQLADQTLTPFARVLLEGDASRFDARLRSLWQQEHETVRRLQNWPH